MLRKGPRTWRSPRNLARMERSIADTRAAARHGGSGEGRGGRRARGGVARGRSYTRAAARAATGSERGVGRARGAEWRAGAFSRRDEGATFFSDERSRNRPGPLDERRNRQGERKIHLEG